MNKANKAAFSKSSLKGLTDTVDRTDQACHSLVVDGGWLLYMVKWEAGQTWQEIADSYLTYMSSVLVRNLGESQWCLMAIQQLAKRP